MPTTATLLLVRMVFLAALVPAMSAPAWRKRHNSPLNPLELRKLLATEPPPLLAAVHLTTEREGVVLLGRNMLSVLLSPPKQELQSAWNTTAPNEPQHYVRAPAQLDLEALAKSLLCALPGETGTSVAIRQPARTEPPLSSGWDWCANRPGFLSPRPVMLPASTGPQYHRAEHAVVIRPAYTSSANVPTRLMPTSVFANVFGFEVHCVFGRGTALETSRRALHIQGSGQVVRCAHPPVEQRAALAGLPVGLLLHRLDTGGEIYLGPPKSAAPLLYQPTPSMISMDQQQLPQLQHERDGEKADQQQAPRPLVCACLIMYNSARFLEEWVRWHFALGLDRVLVYDNDSTDKLAEEVARLRQLRYRRPGDAPGVFPNAPNVQLRAWPHGPGTQHAFMADCGLHLREQGCVTGLFADVDEFLFMSRGKEGGPELSQRIDERVGAWLQAPQPPNSGAWLLPAMPLLTSRARHRTGFLQLPPDGLVANLNCSDGPGYPDYSVGKVLLRLEAWHPSLTTGVHWFLLKEGYNWTILHPITEARLLHFRFPDWATYRQRFDRRPGIRSQAVWQAKRPAVLSRDVMSEEFATTLAVCRSTNPEQSEDPEPRRLVERVVRGAWQAG